MLQHLGSLVLGAQKGASQVDCDGIVPARLRDAGRGTAFTESAGIVVGDVEPAEARYRDCHERLGIVLRAYIAGECGGPPAAAFDLGDEAVEFSFAPRAEDELRAFRGPPSSRFTVRRAPQLRTAER